MKLIVGLGNPGSLYRHNRHNIGFICLDHFAGVYKINLDKKKENARTGSGVISGVPVLLAKPQTGMNNSGLAVSSLMRKAGTAPGNLIVIHDDLDLPLGKLRIRCGGGSGGHNGIISIIEHIGSQDFHRVRVGIGRPCDYPDSNREGEIIRYVLGDFTPEEMQTMSDTIPRVSEALCCLLTAGVTEAMNRFNRF